MPSGSFSLTDNSSFVVPSLSWSTSDNPGANQSTITVVFNAYTTGTQNTFGTFSGGITIDGTRYAISGTRTITTGGAGVVTEIGRASQVITHNANGSRSVAVAADGGIAGTSWTTTSGGGTAVLTDYNRSPSWIDIQVPTPVTRGVAYNGYFNASATSSYSLSGSLPPGLSFNTSSGAITGTPTANGSYGFTVTANGSFEGSISDSRTIVVNPPAPVFTDNSVSSIARVGTPYSDRVEANDATSYSLDSGSLPAGLSLNNNTGQISGNPTTSGTRTFTIRAFNSTGTAVTPTLTITTFNSAGVWNGSTFVSGRVKVWNGSSWKDTDDVRVWNGSSWVQAK